jgi:hypothetical protein
MSKKYLEIGEHGLNGEFYSCEDGPAFRADNLAIATKIAFNNWLREFNPLYRECSLVSISDGEFTVSITDDGEPSRTETHTVGYFGPADIFTADYKLLQAIEQDWFFDLYSKMEKLLNAGDPRVRMSKRSGLIMFNIHFPRYDKNGDWWSSENRYLSDERDLAEQQWEYAMADEKTSEQICARNYDAMKNIQKKQLAETEVSCD